jgi:hypothetical protein
MCKTGKDTELSADDAVETCEAISDPEVKENFSWQTVDVSEEVLDDELELRITFDGCRIGAMYADPFVIGRFSNRTSCLHPHI